MIGPMPRAGAGTALLFGAAGLACILAPRAAAAGAAFWPGRAPVQPDRTGRAGRAVRADERQCRPRQPRRRTSRAVERIEHRHGRTDSPGPLAGPVRIAPGLPGQRALAGLYLR